MKIIPVIPARQWTKNSCGAAMYQMVVRHINGVRCTHAKVAEYLGCKPHGVTFTRLRSALKDADVCTRFVGVSEAKLDYELQKSNLIIVDDMLTWKEPHFVLITGCTSKYYVVIDPLIGIPTLRPKGRVVRSATAAMTAGEYGGVKRSVNRARLRALSAVT